MLREIHEGDYVVVKNLPDPQHFAIVKVVGGYSFEDPDIGYGHVLPAEIINTFHKYSQVVESRSPFISALDREQHPIRRTRQHHQTVIDLVKSDPTAEEKDKPEPFKGKIERLRQSLLTHIDDMLRKNLSDSGTEKLVLEMLRRDGMEVLWNAGAGEKGADILWNAQLGYGLDSKIAVQVKMHWDNDNDTTGIDQLVRAFGSHQVQAGLLVTMANKLGPDLQRRLEDVQKVHNIRVLYGVELYKRLLELVADSNLEIT